MNRLLLLILFFATGSASGQTLYPEVFSCFGGYGETESVQLTWTAGEPLFTTVENSSNILTQGFNQTLIVAEIISGIEMVPDFNLRVFPIPASDYVNLSFQGDHPENLYLYLLDLNGKLLLIRKITKDHEEVDVSGFSPGMYLMRITDNKKNVRLYKIQKTK
jgi:hypothetical protein